MNGQAVSNVEFSDPFGGRGSDQGRPIRANEVNYT